MQLSEEEIARLAKFDIAHIIHPQFHVADHRDAVVYASGKGAVLTDIEGRRPGDTVLLAGKGTEPSIVVGAEQVPWDERGVARELLGGAAGG